MNLFVDALNAQKGLSQVNPLFNNNKDEKLRTQMFHCTYPDQTKFYIQKAIKQVFQVYPFLYCQILTFPENNIQKRYIQLKAILQIQIRGKVCKVDFNMMLPNGFPNKAPYVRIINHNVNFYVDPFYDQLKSTTDPKSYVLNPKLNQIKNWQPSKSLVAIISQSQDMFRQRFPFVKQSNQNSQFKSGGAFKASGSFQSGGSFKNSGSFQSNWSKPSPWQSNHQNYSGNGLYQPQQKFNQPGFNNSGWGSPNSMNSHPNSFGNDNYQNNLKNIAKAQEFGGHAKKNLGIMKNQYCRTLQKIQTMQILKYSLNSQNTYLTKQNYQMNVFLKNNQVQSIQELKSLVKPQDPLSNQILDIVSTIKASQDTVNLLDSKFSNEEITLEEFLKNLRKIQEEKFQQRILLSKCISRKSYA